MEIPHVPTRTGRLVVVVGFLAAMLPLLAATVAAPAQAAAGDLDPTFSVDGKQRTDFGTGASGAAAAVRQGDGKIVAVGVADENFLVARYNLDGSLDPSFSGDGRVQTNFTGFDRASDVALQGNKIVVTGLSQDDDGFPGHFALARYNPDGSLDTNFSGDGKQTTVFESSGVGQANGVALQGDGRIVAVGFTGGFGSDFALARYRLNGSLDTSFSGDGKQTTDFFGGHALALGVAIQADGKIVAVGEDQGPDVEDFLVARYNPNGSLDPSFSGDGLQTTDFFFGAPDLANDLAIQANGRIVAVGVAGGGVDTGRDFGLARYNPNGSLDPNFSGDGRKRTSFSVSGFDSANGVALQGDGRIVAVGDGNGEFALARFLGG